MSVQIAVRLPEEAVTFLDEQVRRGVARSRADFVWQAIRREQRRVVAERDAAIYAESGEDDQLDGLADHAQRLSLDEID